MKKPPYTHSFVSELLIGDKLPWDRWLVVLIAFGLGLAFSGLFLLDKNLEDKILPNTTIDGIYIGGTTLPEALLLLEQRQSEIPEATIVVSVDDIQIASSGAELNLKRNTHYLASVAALHGKEDSLTTRIKQLITSFTNPTHLTSNLEINQESIDTLVSILAENVDVEGKEPTATLTYSGTPSSLSVFEGKTGRKVLVEENAQAIAAAIAAEQFNIPLQVASTSATLTDEEVASFKERAKKFVGTQITLKYDKDISIYFTDRDIISLLRFPEDISKDTTQEFLDTWSEKIYREPQNAVFEYSEETKTVTEFAPHRKGRKLDTEKTFELLASEIDKLSESETTETEILLPITTLEPAIILSATNGYGISERIGFGESYYYHSIPTRINNVAVTAARVNNKLIAPGEEFSFNKTLGEVSKATGFQPAYVIANGRTELGDGGGVCQVSSTLFRSLLDAGLNISRRLPHSYRVSYYELNSDPGFDATVYSGNIDLRFINDTDHYVLIHTTNDRENLHLTVELFGTSDGRTTEVTDYKKWGATPALPTEYINDPTLPAGVKKQVDWAVSGLKAKFTHTVKDAEGEVLYQNTYSSTYRPWSAKYLVGTGS